MSPTGALNSVGKYFRTHSYLPARKPVMKRKNSIMTQETANDVSIWLTIRRKTKGKTTFFLPNISDIQLKRGAPMNEPNIMADEM